MATAEGVGTALAKTKTKDLRDLINEASRELARALPQHMRPERLVRIALTLIRTTPELSRCTPESFMGSLFVSAQLGVEPVAGQAYILPFNNKRKIGDEWQTVKEAQFVLGYKGLASLFYRHEKAVQLSWAEVREHDGFDYELGTNAKLVHRPATKDRGAVRGYYVIATLNNGGKPFLYMSREDCLEHGKKHSKTYDKKAGEFYKNSPWATNFDAMALKTVLIQLGKLLPLSVEIQRAIEADETSRDYRKGIDDALDITPTTNWNDTEATKDAPKESAKAVGSDTPKEVVILHGNYSVTIEGASVSIVDQAGEFQSTNAAVVEFFKTAQANKSDVSVLYWPSENYPYEIESVKAINKKSKQ